MSNPNPEVDPLHTGDIFDDDAAIQERYTSENAVPGIPVFTPTVDTGAKREPTTHLFTGTVRLAPPGEEIPFIVAPANPLRRGLSVRFRSSATADYVIVTDTQNPLGGFRLFANQDSPSILDKHTGEVWVTYGSVTTEGWVTWAGVNGK